MVMTWVWGAGPVISNIATSNITNTTAQVSWSLNMPAQGYVEYGPTTSYGNETTHETSYNYSSHLQTISGLVAGTTYHYRVHSFGPQGTPIETISADQSFATTGGGVVYDATFSGDATGATDVTAALQSFLNGHNNQSVALAVSGTYKVTRVIMQSSGVRVAYRGSHLQGTTAGLGVLAMVNCQNTILDDPGVIGTGYSYTDPTQWEHGIDICGGTNITINTPVLHDLKGDGIYIGTDTGPYTASPAVNVVINNPNITRTGRNGISPVAGEVTINGGTISHSGLMNIDFEANNGTQQNSIKGVVSGTDCRTWGDLAATQYACTCYAIVCAGAGSLTGTAQYLRFINCTGDTLRMRIDKALAGTITGCTSTNATYADFNSVNSITFSGNSANISQV